MSATPRTSPMAKQEQRHQPVASPGFLGRSDYRL